MVAQPVLHNIASVFGGVSLVWPHLHCIRTRNIPKPSLSFLMWSSRLIALGFRMEPKVVNPVLRLTDY